MRWNRVGGIYAFVVCVSILQASCAPRTHEDAQMPCGPDTAEAQPPLCGDPFVFYSELAAQTDEAFSTSDMTPLSVENDTAVCPKLRKAIFLSLPGSKTQNDKEALEILQELERTGVLSGQDLLFIDMLLQHVYQRQDLRDKIAAQEVRLVDVEQQKTELLNQLTTLQSQLDQLKNIEVEIDKKERSLTNPSKD